MSPHPVPLPALYVPALLQQRGEREREWGDEDIYRGMRAGAKSYLLKDVRREELFQCIREVHAGRTFLPPAVAAKLAERLPTEELTPRELEVLRLRLDKKIAEDVAAG